MAACSIMWPKSVAFFLLIQALKVQILTQFLFHQKNTFPAFTENWDLNTLTAISTWAKNSGFDKNYGWHLLLEERVKNGP